MSKKVLGMKCGKYHETIPLTIEHGIYCQHYKALMVIADLVSVIKDEE